MQTNSVIAFLATVAVLFIIGKIFLLPIKSLLKLIGNSILGGVLIAIINLIGGFFNFHIGLNILTSIFVGILGIPGAILLIILKLFI